MTGRRATHRLWPYVRRAQRAMRVLLLPLPRGAAAVRVRACSRRAVMPSGVVQPVPSIRRAAKRPSSSAATSTDTSQLTESYACRRRLSDSSIAARIRPATKSLCCAGATTSARVLALAALQALRLNDAARHVATRGDSNACGSSIPFCLPSAQVTAAACARWPRPLTPENRCCENVHSSKGCLMKHIVYNAINSAAGEGALIALR